MSRNGCLTAPFPPNSKCSTLLKGMDGTALWNLTIEELRALESEGASEGHMPQEELEQLLVAVSSLRAKKSMSETTSSQHSTFRARWSHLWPTHTHACAPGGF